MKQTFSRVATDYSWLTAGGPILRSHKWAGEVFDVLRFAGTGAASGLPAAEVARRCEPERIIPGRADATETRHVGFGPREVIVGTLP